MRAITINRPALCTRLEIWQPRYSDAYKDTNERVALLARYKVEHGTDMILVEFTRAKHLAGQRYCIRRDEAMKAPLDSNGKIPCYAVRMSAFCTWQSGKEITDIANDIFKD